MDIALTDACWGPSAQQLTLWLVLAGWASRLLLRVLKEFLVITLPMLVLAAWPLIDAVRSALAAAPRELPGLIVPALALFAAIHDTVKGWYSPLPWLQSRLD